jgi:DNA-binding transcriptional ArsR family regulator
MNSLDRTFSALSHPIRRRVLARLQHGELPVKDLTVSLKISGPALTKHLHILERAGLITRSREAQRRPCRLSVRPIRELDEWMETYRRFWEESFDRLDEHLKGMQNKKREERK